MEYHATVNKDMVDLCFIGKEVHESMSHSY